METYYQLHREVCLEKQKQYNREHKDKIKEYHKRYWLTKTKPKIQSSRPPRPTRTPMEPREPREPRQKTVKIPRPPKAPLLPSSECDEEYEPDPEPMPSIVIDRTPITLSFK